MIRKEEAEIHRDAKSWDITMDYLPFGLESGMKSGTHIRNHTDHLPRRIRENLFSLTDRRFALEKDPSLTGVSNRWLYNRFGILEGYTSDDSPESKSKTGGVEQPLIYRPSKAKYEEALKKKPKGTSKERCKKKIGKKERRNAVKPLRGKTSTAIRIHLPAVNLVRVAHNEGGDHLKAPQRPPSPEPPSDLQISIRDLLLPGCIHGEVGRPLDQSFMMSHQDVIGSSYFAAQVRHMHGMLNVKKVAKVVKGTPLSGRNPSGPRSVPQVEIKKPRPAVIRRAKNAKSLSPLPITAGIPDKKKPKPVREKRKDGIAEPHTANRQEYMDRVPSSAREGNITVDTWEAACPSQTNSNAAACSSQTNSNAAVPVLRPQIDGLLTAKAVAEEVIPEGPPRKTERANGHLAVMDGASNKSYHMQPAVTNALKQGKDPVDRSKTATKGVEGSNYTFTKRRAQRARTLNMTAQISESPVVPKPTRPDEHHKTPGLAKGVRTKAFTPIKEPKDSAEKSRGLKLSTPIVSDTSGKSAKVATDKNGPHIRPRSVERKAKKKAAVQSVVEAAVRRSPRHIR